MELVEDRRNGGSNNGKEGCKLWYAMMRVTRSEIVNKSSAVARKLERQEADQAASFSLSA